MDNGGASSKCYFSLIDTVAVALSLLSELFSLEFAAATAVLFLYLIGCLLTVFGGVLILFCDVDF